MFLRPYLLTACALIPITFLTAALPSSAGPPHYEPHYRDYGPPSAYGYNLDDRNPGYFGGGRYREYYSYGRGYGLSNFPGPLPEWNPHWLRGIPVGPTASKPVAVAAPV